MHNKLINKCILRDSKSITLCNDCEKVLLIFYINLFFLLQFRVLVRRLEKPLTILCGTAAQHFIFVLVVHLQANWGVQMATIGTNLYKTVNNHVATN